MLVCDEAHHLTGRTDFVTRRILDRRFFPAKRRLFGTATPRVDLRQSGDNDAPVASMDDEEVFGPLLYRYPFAQAIREQWLCDYRLAVIGVSVTFDDRKLGIVERARLLQDRVRDRELADVVEQAADREGP